MKTSAAAYNEDKAIAGWVICFNDGRRQFMTGISRDGAFRVADSKSDVYYVRAFGVENGTRVVYC